MFVTFKYDVGNFIVLHYLSVGPQEEDNDHLYKLTINTLRISTNSTNPTRALHEWLQTKKVRNSILFLLYF